MKKDVKPATTTGSGVEADPAANASPSASSPSPAKRKQAVKQDDAQVNNDRAGIKVSVSSLADVQ
jgi:hypothetical protein